VLAGLCSLVATVGVLGTGGMLECEKKNPAREFEFIWQYIISRDVYFTARCQRCGKEFRDAHEPCFYHPALFQPDNPSNDTWGMTAGYSCCGAVRQTSSFIKASNLLILVC